MRIVVAGFEPFEGRTRNRSERAARRLIGTPGVTVATLPVSFARIGAEVERLFATDPDVVVLCGESARAECLLVERVALNLADARIADNDGAQPRGERLERNGPLAREVGFDPHELVRGLDVPAAASAHAGTFVCNAALYYALGRASRGRVAFVHVPAKKSHLDARSAARGLRKVVDFLRPAGARESI